MTERILAARPQAELERQGDWADGDRRGVEGEHPTEVAGEEHGGGAERVGVDKLDVRVRQLARRLRHRWERSEPSVWPPWSGARAAGAAAEEGLGSIGRSPPKSVPRPEPLVISVPQAGMVMH